MKARTGGNTDYLFEFFSFEVGLILPGSALAVTLGPVEAAQNVLFMDLKCAPLYLISVYAYKRSCEALLRLPEAAH